MQLTRRQWLVTSTSILSTSILAGCAEGGVDGTTATSSATEERTTTPTQEQESTTTATPTETTTGDVTTAETATPLSSSAGLQAISFSEQDESYVLSGQVKNTSERELANVRVSANFYDENDRLVFERWDAVSFLDPDQSYLLRIPYVEGQADASVTSVDRYELTKNVRLAPLTPKNSGEVDVMNHSFEQRDEEYGVRGELKNITDETLTRIYPIANFLNSEGTVISAYRDGASDLDPDEIFSFEIPYIDRYRPPAEAVTDYKLTIIVQR